MPQVLRQNFIFAHLKRAMRVSRIHLPQSLPPPHANMSTEATDTFSLSAVLASTIPGDRVEEYVREFKRCDADGSGRVSVSEVRGAAATLGHDVSDEEAKELVSAVDADADGTISFEEFCKVGCGSSARLCGCAHLYTHAPSSLAPRTWFRCWSEHAKLAPVVSICDSSRTKALACTLGRVRRRSVLPTGRLVAGCTQDRVVTVHRCHAGGVLFTH